MLLTHPSRIAVKFTIGILNSQEPTEDIQSTKPGLWYITVVVRWRVE